MAIIDREHDISSTFFLLLSSDYNCFDEDGSRIIRDILDMGHELGLHYDAGILGQQPGCISEIVKAQIALVETFFHTTISAVSPHMPRRNMRLVAFPGIVNAYSPEYFTKIRYVSDSLQTWREGSIVELLPQHDMIQLLTHECNWSVDGRSWSTAMLKHSERRAQRHLQATHDWIATLHEGLVNRQSRDEAFRREAALVWDGDARPVGDNA